MTMRASLPDRQVGTMGRIISHLSQESGVNRTQVRADRTVEYNYGIECARDMLVLLIC
jgi:hypothetical protein